uniref:uncharacterized protein LOC122602692 isoform X3 n=1 Tax=Erigeron canadensis TaxID=72917 RepID=UPI001CB8E7E0|nr:uncharacterized protein LOC122602692 isoform X3 [Erigeron canadensis]
MGSKDDHTPSSQPWLSSYNSQALQQLLSQFGLQVQSHNGAPTTAYYANRGRGRGGRGNQNYGRRSSNSNRSQLNGGNRNRFAWASNQNTVFGTCNRCGIGHIPILCPNRDPSTYRRSTPPQANYADCSSQENYADYRSQANYADHRSQASTSWLTDTGCNHHVGVLIFQVLNTRNHIMAMTDFMLVMIMREIGQDLSGFKCVQHTSASLTINENYDSDVRADTETFLNKIVPEGGSAPWRHTLEGPDDMPAHIKSSMFGCALTIPITDGKLNMGTWQGIWLCEHRDEPTARKVVVTLNGI